MALPSSLVQIKGNRIMFAGTQEFIVFHTVSFVSRLLYSLFFLEEFICIFSYKSSAFMWVEKGCRGQFAIVFLFLSLRDLFPHVIYYSWYFFYFAWYLSYFCIFLWFFIFSIIFFFCIFHLLPRDICVCVCVLLIYLSETGFRGIFDKCLYNVPDVHRTKNPCVSLLHLFLPLKCCKKVLNNWLSYTRLGA